MNELTKTQEYSFAATGIIIVREFLPRETIDKMKTAVEGIEKPKFPFIDTNPPLFMELMSHPWIMDCCSKFVGRWFRFDHQLGVRQSKEDEAYLHGGAFGSQGTCYHVPLGETSWNGQLTFGLALSGQSDEGFSYIPGSHRTDLRRNSHGSIWNEVLNWFSSEDRWRQGTILETPQLEPGDLVVFSEALIHGQSKWTRTIPRTTLYYKYVPGHMAWMDFELIKNLQKYATTPQQKALLQRPYVRSQCSGETFWREPIVKKEQ